MKLRLLLIALFCIGATSLLAQSNITSRGFGFQGYARNTDGSAVSSETIRVKFIIYKTGGGDVFEEVHTVDTDAFGVFTAEVGSENTVLFQGIDFVGQDLNLRVEVSIDAGNFIEISNTKFHSVPYAQAAAFAFNGLPSGAIIPFGGTEVPDGFVACDGSEYDRTDDKYKALYDAIGTNWGGSGNDFRVPDLGGYFLRGWGDGDSDPNADDRVSLHDGGNTGNKVGTYQESEVKAHAHNVQGTTLAGGFHTNKLKLGVAGAVDENTVLGGRSTGIEGLPEVETLAGGAHIHQVLGTAGLSGGDESRPKNAAVLYIIKL